MSTTSKKPPLKHESWQDKIKTTDDEYREYDKWVRTEKAEEDKRKERMVNELAAKKELMLAEKERNEIREKILAKSKAKLFENKKIKEEEIKKRNNSWWVGVLNVIMGWENE